MTALAALCLGLVVMTTSVAGCGSSADGSGGNGYTASMQAALGAANKVAVDLTTFDYRDLDAHYATMEADGTANLKKALEATRADITAYDQQLKVVGTGTVIASAAQPEASDGSVTVLLFVDQQLQAVDAKVSGTYHARLQLVMREINGTWLVDKATVTGAPS